MKFVDSAIIYVEAGHGGDGCGSFHRARFIAQGKPDGGNGGRGGNIFLQGDAGLNNLVDFRHHRRFCADHGSAGKSNNRQGRSGDDLIIKVPLGTKIYNVATNELIGEIVKHDARILVAQGGAHGLGNAAFKSSVNRSPQQFTCGGMGEARELALELSLIADIGLVGLPNAGKSSLMAQLTNAKPKIADYPFTTLSPHLGVVNTQDKRIVIADIPGIIENASRGAGLGYKFLRHLTRTKLLLHVIDIMPNNSTPIEQYCLVEKELKRYDKRLLAKTQLVVLNKLDLLTPAKRIAHIKNIRLALKNAGYYDQVIAVSAHSGDNIAELSALIQALNS